MLVLPSLLPSQKSSNRSFLRRVHLVGFFWVALQVSNSTFAIVLYDTDNPLQNSTAPAGILEDAGWQYLGLYGGFLGTAISPTQFITAQHIGDQGSSFTQSAAFTGGSEVVHTINAAANGGVGFWDIAGTDLRIYEVMGSGFSEYAPLYTGFDEIGKGIVVYGRGSPKGAEVIEGGDLKGWLHTGGDGITRWGQNTVSALTVLGGGSLLAASFDAIPAVNEASLSVGDSGGPVFILEGGQWKLAGINYAVDGGFDTNNVKGDGSEFGAALFDRGGLYQGSDATSWTYNPDLPTDNPSSMYASRISTSAAQIQSITLVPEPGSMILVLVGLMSAVLDRFMPHRFRQR